MTRPLFLYLSKLYVFIESIATLMN